jgi:predicted RNA-binding Zn-ribbon protein involved in translation (DUF1610 family)
MYISNYEYQKLKLLEQDLHFRCPKCGSTNNYEIKSRPDYRYSNCGEYTVKCTKCKHYYGVNDNCTG